MPKIRNIIIFVAIAAVLILAYVFFIKPSLNNSQPTLVSSSGVTATNTTTTSGGTTNATVVDGTSVAQNFLTLVLSVQTIKLNVGIFTDGAFTSLQNSSVTLTPDATIGRPNPFAQFDTTTTSSTTTINSTKTIPTISTPTTPAATTH